MNPRVRFEKTPPAIAALPVNEKGFPVPWFVPWIDDKPDFRAVDPRQILKAHRESRCWICGGKLGGTKVFAIGPMCGVNRVSAEPPSHLVCARFAVKACPFMSRPLAKRAAIDDLATAQPPAGIMLEHNPGVTLLWTTQTYRFEREDDVRGLFRIGSPTKVEWYREGREATHDEALEAIHLGLPKLFEMAAQDERRGFAGSVAALREKTLRLNKYLPKEDGHAPS